MPGYAWRGKRTLADLNARILEQRKPLAPAYLPPGSRPPHGTRERYWHELRWEHGACPACRRARHQAVR